MFYIQGQSSWPGTSPWIYFLSLLHLLVKRKNQCSFSNCSGRFPRRCWTPETVYPADNSPPPPSRKDFRYFNLNFSSFRLAGRAVQVPEQPFWLQGEAASSVQEGHGQGCLRGTEHGVFAHPGGGRSPSPRLGQSFSVREHGFELPLEQGLSEASAGGAAGEAARWV